MPAFIPFFATMASQMPDNLHQWTDYERRLSLYLQWGNRRKFLSILMEIRLSGETFPKYEWWIDQWNRRWPRRRIREVAPDPTPVSHDSGLGDRIGT